MKCDMLIKDAAMMTPDFEIAEHRTIIVHRSRIVEIGTYEELKAKYEPEHTLDGKGKLCMPGLVDAHTHTCQQLLKGRTMDELPMIWSRILVPFEGNLDEEDVRVSAQMSCLEMIKSGTTAFADAGGVHMQRTVEAAVESGMRAAITRSAIDIGDFLPNSMKQSAQEIIDNNEWLYKTYHGAGDGRIHIWFGIRQVMSCSPELIQAAAEKARQYNTGLHAHLAEHRDEVRYCLETYKKRPAEYLDSLGALGPNLLTAHNVVYSEAELALLKERNVNIVHCPRVNFNSHGIPKTPQMLRMGMNVGLGSDGASSSNLSLFDEMRVFRSGIHVFWGLPVFDPVVLPAKELVKMATMGSAKALLLEREIGTVEEGKKADLILINIDQPHISPAHSLINMIVESVTSKDVEDVIIDGKLVMRNREVLTLDEERILYESKRRMKSTAEKAGIWQGVL
ncbi:cytosine deaminase [Gordoniibacillus kamchatkensis]|uniref:Cytosine deaminase n=1 Tax=Gordoniibacillus kamchatkensis TaxID=1590651 RepID=A0ABR5ACR5_9BACL|nr:amidohydrolase [Paenibacillus sp. VKM B-2647]KIL38750.1 cytosine deaminase [Paenibacillus sp. VKM B-2647]